MSDTRSTTELRCNYYFGGVNGGNRCQKQVDHEEGHIWVANHEPAQPPAPDAPTELIASWRARWGSDAAQTAFHICARELECVLCQMRRQGA